MSQQDRDFMMDTLPGIRADWFDKLEAYIEAERTKVRRQYSITKSIQLLTQQAIIDMLTTPNMDTRLAIQLKLDAAIAETTK